MTSAKTIIKKVKVSLTYMATQTQMLCHNKEVRMKVLIRSHYLSGYVLQYFIQKLKVKK